MDINKSRKKWHEIEYDYENYYDKLLDDDVIERLIKGRVLTHHYTTKTITSGNQFEVEIYPRFSKQDFEKYKPKKKPSKRSQKNLNEKNAKKNFIRLVNTNFTEDDYVIHLTYSNKYLPMSIEDAENEVKKYIARINYHRKKKGLGNARYIYVTEYDENKKIRCHHHMIIDGMMDRKILKKLWKNGIRTRVEELEPDEFGLTGLASYLSKDPKGKKRWKSSKGLKKPKERRSYTSFSKKKIRKMVEDESCISVIMNQRYRSKRYLDHEIRYNAINGMFYIYVKMRDKG